MKIKISSGEHNYEVSSYEDAEQVINDLRMAEQRYNLSKEKAKAAIESIRDICYEGHCDQNCPFWQVSNKACFFVDNCKVIPDEWNFE